MEGCLEEPTKQQQVIHDHRTTHVACRLPARSTQQHATIIFMHATQPRYQGRNRRSNKGAQPKEEMEKGQQGTKGWEEVGGEGGIQERKRERERETETETDDTAPLPSAALALASPARVSCVCSVF